MTNNQQNLVGRGGKERQLGIVGLRNPEQRFFDADERWRTGVEKSDEAAFQLGRYRRGLPTKGPDGRYHWYG